MKNVRCESIIRIVAGRKVIRCDIRHQTEKTASKLGMMFDAETTTGAKAKNFYATMTRPWKGRSSTVAPASGATLLPRSLCTHTFANPLPIMDDEPDAAPWKSGA